MVRHRIVHTVALLSVVSVVLAACGGSGGGGGDGSKISQVRSCLKSAQMTVTEPEGPDATKIEEGVSATSGIGDDGRIDAAAPLTIVVAARVKSSDEVDSFTKASKDFSKNLSAEQRKSFSVQSGSDGKYVWVVAGDKSSDVFSAAEKCVEP